jgi:amidase
MLLPSIAQTFQLFVVVAVILNNLANKHSTMKIQFHAACKKGLALLLAGILTGLHTTAQTTNEKAEPVITCPGRQLPYPRQEPLYDGKIKRDLSPFEQALKAFEPKAAQVKVLVSNKSIPELQRLMNQKKISSVQLLLYYLSRIKKYDINKLNAVLELNPDALRIAAALDKERAVGKVRGPMHGIPVLLKDNIATGDQLHTAAGSAAMFNWHPQRDAFLAAQLRKAGAIIMGKANLSEWANYMDPCMPSGFSTTGGQTRNPYGPFETWGSSSGSAVAVAADLATVTVGSETQGSIIMPAWINSVVGLKTSMGLVSRDYVIPLLGYQDVPGPMGKTVTDVAIMLSAMTGTDANDKATSNASRLSGTDFSKYTKAGAARGMKVGVTYLTDEEVTSLLEKNKSMTAERISTMRKFYEDERNKAMAMTRVLEAAGITVVRFPREALPKGLSDISKTLEYGFKEDLNHFLKSLGNNAPFASMADIIAYNNEDLKNRAPYGQGYLVAANNTKITAEDFAAMREKNIHAAQQRIDSLLQAYGLDLVFSSVSQVYAPAGYPAISIPTGYDENGSPVNAVFVGTYLSEPKLLAVGYAVEQGLHAWAAPDLDKTMKLIEGIKRINY